LSPYGLSWSRSTTVWRPNALTRARSKIATPGWRATGNAAALGVDAGRLVIVGVSAGGGLAAATAIVARDRGGPHLKGQMLICPMLDDRNNSLSSRQYATNGNWNGRNNEVGWTALLGNQRGAPGVPPEASPARLGDFHGLPPAFIDAGSAEVFSDEVVQYASSCGRRGCRRNCTSGPEAVTGSLVWPRTLPSQCSLLLPKRDG
jgi:acetyl esterase/lipase